MQDSMAVADAMFGLAVPLTNGRLGMMLDDEKEELERKDDPAHGHLYLGGRAEAGYPVRLFVVR